MIAPPRSDAPPRLKLLRELGIMDSASEAAYDDLVQLAALIFEVPTAAVSLLDDRRQWFKARCGLEAAEMDLQVSFCAHALEQEGTLIVEDATQDPRFRKNPIVTGEPFVRFYAGVPIVVGGVAVGTLCVIDPLPRRPRAHAIEALERLARQVANLLEGRALARRLMASEARFEAFMEHAPIAAYIKDAEGRYVYANPYTTRVYAPVAGTVDRKWLEVDLAREIRQHEDDARARGTAITREFRASMPDGSVRDWSVVKFPFEDPSGGCLIGALATEVTAHKEATRLALRHLEETQDYAERLADANERLSVLAATDALTGLLNRRAFLDELAMAIKGESIALIALDVDRFKDYNDTYGHPAGDEVLRRIAGIVQEAAPEAVVARLGGEEFAALLPHAGEAESLETAEAIRQAVEDAAWSLRPVTASFGVALAVANDNTEELLLRADRALYRAKARGRNQVAR